MGINKYKLEEAIKAADRERRGWVLNQALCAGLSFGDLLTDLAPFIDAEVEREAQSSDPLAALEAAERRLLESARWTPGDRGFWIDPDDGTQWPREGAISDARRRLAAKGGA